MKYLEAAIMLLLVLCAMNVLYSLGNSALVSILSGTCLFLIWFVWDALKSRNSESLRALPFTVSAALFALLFLWRSFQAREIQRDPPPLELLSPRFRALARARLFQRAGRFDLLAEQLLRGWVLEQGAAARLPESACLAALSDPQAARDFARQLGAGADAERWAGTLAGRSVADARGLTALERELRALQTGHAARPGAELRTIRRSPSPTPSS